MEQATLGSYLLIILLIAFSAFFSGSEIGYASLNGFRMKQAAEAGSMSAKIAYQIYQAYDSALIAILIGNNLVNIAASSVATVIAVSLMGDEGAWVATAVMTVLILTFGEILPKILARQMSDSFARIVAVPLQGVIYLTKPIVLFINKALSLLDRLWARLEQNGPSVTEDDLETILETAEDEGVIDEDRAELLQSALDFDEVLAYEIITPRVDMLAIDADDDWNTIVRTVWNASFSRIPVYRDTTDHIIGILHQNRFLKKTVDGDVGELSEMLLPVNFVHKTMPLNDVLAVMKKRQCHMVIVTDEYGGTMGCLTMEDVLEQLVGDIWDESDEIVDEFVEIGEGCYEASGDMRIYDFFEELDIDDRDFDDDNATLGGWAIEMLGDYPKVNDSFTYQNLTLTVKKLRNLRVMRMGIMVHPPTESE